MSELSAFERTILTVANTERKKRLIRILMAVFRAMMKSQIKLFSTSLTYHTLLTIVPILAVIFALLKPFAIGRNFKGMINEILVPMGEAGKQVSDYLFQFIDNAQAGFLGGMGLLFLLYSVFTLLGKIEQSLNHLWFIEEKRNLTNKLFNYLGVIMLTVVVAAIAVTLTVFLHNDSLLQQWNIHPIVALLTTGLVRVLSIIVTAIMLAVVYSGAINTEVNFKAAFIGGLFCTILWLPLTTIFAKLIGLSTSYSVIYSSFAALVILLVWINILWLLFLSGGLVAYFVQYPTLLQPYSMLRLNPAEMEYYSDKIIKAIINKFNRGEGASELAEIMSNTQLSHRQVLHLLKPFINDQLITTVGSANMDYLPAVNPTILTDDFIKTTVRGVVRQKN